VLIPGHVHAVPTVVSAQPLILNFPWLHANLVQLFSLGALALACSIFWSRRGKQTGQLLEKILIAFAAAFVAFANWESIGTLMQNAINKG
jgi:hypothetical protein